METAAGTRVVAGIRATTGAIRTNGKAGKIRTRADSEPLRRTVRIQLIPRLHDEFRVERDCKPMLQEGSLEMYWPPRHGAVAMKSMTRFVRSVSPDGCAAVPRRA